MGETSSSAHFAGGLVLAFRAPSQHPHPPFFAGKYWALHWAGGHLGQEPAPIKVPYSGVPCSRPSFSDKKNLQSPPAVIIIIITTTTTLLLMKMASLLLYSRHCSKHFIYICIFTHLNVKTAFGGRCAYYPHWMAE